MKNNTWLLLGLVGVAAYFIGKKAAGSTVNPMTAFGPGTINTAPSPSETGVAIPVQDAMMPYKPEPENPYGPVTQNKLFPWAMNISPLTPANTGE